MPARALLLPLFFFLPYIVVAQQTLNGRLIDAKDGTPLAYVNVGIPGENVGTVADAAGNFRLRIPERYADPSVKFSLLGYAGKSFRAAELRELLAAGQPVPLQARVFDLEEIVVIPKFTRTKVIGNPAKAARMTDGFYGNDLGREGGIIIPLKERFRPAQVLKFRIHIASSTYDRLRFRLNFYSVKDKIPDQPLPQESIIVETALRSGVLEVDLEDYHILVRDDFAVTLEWIEDFGPGDLQFSFRRFGPRCVFRYASQADWESYSGLLAPSPHLNVTIGY